MMSQQQVETSIRNIESIDTDQEKFDRLNGYIKELLKDIKDIKDTIERQNKNNTFSRYDGKTAQKYKENIQYKFDEMMMYKNILADIKLSRPNHPL